MGMLCLALLSFSIIKVTFLQGPAVYMAATLEILRLAWSVICANIFTSHVFLNFKAYMGATGVSTIVFFEFLKNHQLQFFKYCKFNELPVPIL
jgi:hypothetical protein